MIALIRSVAYETSASRQTNQHNDQKYLILRMIGGKQQILAEPHAKPVNRTPRRTLASHVCVAVSTFATERRKQ